MIYNKSTHPVEVKKISVRLWALRDEIEAALSRRIKECEAAGVPLYIEDIKTFYNIGTAPDQEGDASNVIPLKAKANETEGESDPVPPTEEENKTPEVTIEAAPEVTPEAVAEAGPENSLPTDEKTDSPVPPEENKTLNQAEEIITQQNNQGLDTNHPNPILARPYQRQAPDLEHISYGFTFLSDINMKTILIFTRNKFLHGQSVVIEFLIPQNFTMTANILYCHHFAQRSRIISSTKPDYRLQCLFDFSLPKERETLRNFLKSIEPSFVHAPKKIKKELEDDSPEA